MTCSPVVDAPSRPHLLTALAEDLWVVSRPVQAAPGLCLDHRMTVARLPEGGLWVHSPVPWNADLAAELALLGPVRQLVAPSRFHDLAWPEWFATHPEAEFRAAPGVRAAHPELPFGGDLADGPVAGGALQARVLQGMPAVNETVFLHRASGSLIVADLVFNYGARPAVPATTRWLLRAAGTWGRTGASRFLRLAVRDRGALRRSLDEVLGWDFDRIVVGHGDVVEADGRAALDAAWSHLRS